MPCEHHKDALIEAAASGAEPQGELRAHLVACAACRSAFAEEQSLFASIDAGLHSTANVEVPASLLPRVRARLAESAPPAREWLTNRFVLAGAAAMAVALFAAHAVWRADDEHRPVATVTNSIAPARVSPPQVRNSVPLPPVRKNSVSQPRALIVRSLVPRESLASHDTTPEVLVPRDEEVLVVRYAEEWRRRKHAPLLAANSDATNLSPLQIVPIQIAQLDVKLMAEE